MRRRNRIQVNPAGILFAAGLIVVGYALGGLLGLGVALLILAVINAIPTGLD